MLRSQARFLSDGIRAKVLGIVGEALGPDEGPDIDELYARLQWQVELPNSDGLSVEMKLEQRGSSKLIVLVVQQEGFVPYYILKVSVSLDGLSLQVTFFANLAGDLHGMVMGEKSPHASLAREFLEEARIAVEDMGIGPAADDPPTPFW